MKNNKLYISLSLIIVGLFFTGCTKWTDTENLEVNDPNISHQNPELYAAYVKNLNDYKASDHKYIYTWFQNEAQIPQGRVNHITSLPDSIDVISLTHPDNLEPFELNDIQEVRQLGTKVVYTIDYESIKTEFRILLEEQEEQSLETRNNSKEDYKFLDFLRERVNHYITLSDKYQFDGIIIAYQGKSKNHLTEEQIIELNELQETFLYPIKDWASKNKDKFLTFLGLPQNITDKTIFNECKHIIIDTKHVMSSYGLTQNILMALVEGVPTDRFIIRSTTPSMNPDDVKTGYFNDGSLAIIQSALWVANPSQHFIKAGLAIDNSQNDYYNPSKTYPTIREAIDFMNPSPKL